jgi:hypothetical protein
MTSIPPLVFQWDGEAMVPAHSRLADRHFVIGETYTLVPREDRSAASHRHYFASVAEAHNNLPESWALRLPTSEHLRKYALIKAGYCDSQTLIARSAASARDIAAFLRPIDEFSIVTVEGCAVTRFTAKSQSERAMGKKDFQASKEAVLDIISELIGVDRRELDRARAA